MLHSDVIKRLSSVGQRDTLAPPITYDALYNERDRRILLSLHNNPNFCSPLLLWLFSSFGTCRDSDWTNEEAAVEPLLSSVSLPKFDNVYCSSAATAGLKQFESPPSPISPSLCQIERGLLSLFNLIRRDNQSDIAIYGDEFHKRTNNPGRAAQPEICQKELGEGWGWGGVGGVLAATDCARF